MLKVKTLWRRVKAAVESKTEVEATAKWRKVVKETADVNGCVKSKIKPAWRVKVESE